MGLGAYWISNLDASGGKHGVYFDGFYGTLTGWGNLGLILFLGGINGEKKNTRLHLSDTTCGDFSIFSGLYVRVLSNLKYFVFNV